MYKLVASKAVLLFCYISKRNAVTWFIPTQTKKPPRIWITQYELFQEHDTCNLQFLVDEIVPTAPAFLVLLKKQHNSKGYIYEGTQWIMRVFCGGKLHENENFHRNWSNWPKIFLFFHDICIYQSDAWDCWRIIIPGWYFFSFICFDSFENICRTGRHSDKAK